MIFRAVIGHLREEPLSFHTLNQIENQQCQSGITRRQLGVMRAQAEHDGLNFDITTLMPAVIVATRSISPKYFCCIIRLWRKSLIASMRD